MTLVIVFLVLSFLFAGAGFALIAADRFGFGISMMLLAGLFDILWIIFLVVWITQQVTPGS